jgi:hypothetical protein
MTPRGLVRLGQFAFVGQIWCEMQERQEGRFFARLLGIGHGVGRDKELILAGVLLAVAHNHTILVITATRKTAILWRWSRLSFAYFVEQLTGQALPLRHQRLTLCRNFGLLRNGSDLTRRSLLLVTLAGPHLVGRIPLVSAARSFRTIPTDTLEGIVTRAP